jgi:hypothetical protein
MQGSGFHPQHSKKKKKKKKKTTKVITHANMSSCVPVRLLKARKVGSLCQQASADSEGASVLQVHTLPEPRKRHPEIAR